jgi:hypothetical protein
MVSLDFVRNFRMIYSSLNGIRQQKSGLSNAVTAQNGYIDQIMTAKVLVILKHILKVDRILVVLLQD